MLLLLISLSTYKYLSLSTNVYTPGWILSWGHNRYRPDPKDGGRLCFHRRLSVNRGVPHLHPVILPLVPRPFPGVPHPGQDWGGGGSSPHSRTGMGYAHPGQDGVPPSQVRMGYSQPDQDGVTPGQVRMGYPPDRDGVLPPPLSRTSHGHAAVGTPLAVSRRRNFLF